MICNFSLISREKPHSLKKEGSLCLTVVLLFGPNLYWYLNLKNMRDETIHSVFFS